MKLKAKEYSYLVCPAERECFNIERDEEMPLKEMQDYVGGYIEVVKHGLNYLIINEDGIAEKLPMNRFFPPCLGTVILATKME